MQKLFHNTDHTERTKTKDIKMVLEIFITSVVSMITAVDTALTTGAKEGSAEEFILPQR